ncbi:hypothetical protein IKJ53_05455, partial [bacterium]|nr:hypothetical protein [bacterium]
NDEYITIKNFVAKDVTNNGNAKKGIEDESSVELLLKDSATPIDLREYLYQRDTEKNYTGSWLNEDINAEEYKKYDKKGELIKDNTQKGLSLNGKDGDDEITGSNYSDTIKGGNGDDIIKGGTGNDKLYGEAGKNTFVFEVGHGNDTVYAGKGEDTLEFSTRLIDMKFNQVTTSKGVGTKDLEIVYGEDDKVVVKNYFTTDKKGVITGVNTNNSVKYITTSESTFNLEDVFFGEQNGFFIGTDNNDVLIGDSGNDIFVSGNGDDFITVGKGNDLIYTGEGQKIYIFDSGDGEDVIYSESDYNKIKFNDVIDFTPYTDGDDLIINYGDNDKVTLKDFVKNNMSVAIVDAKDENYTIQTGVGTFEGSDAKDYVVLGNSGSFVTGGKGDDYFSGGFGNDRFVFNTGDGTDTINYEAGVDVIKFNDVNIEDIVFSEYDLENNSLSMSYGASDKLIINGLTSDKSTLKIEDSTGKQYSVYLGNGNNAVQKPEQDENAVFVGSNGKDNFVGNANSNVFAAINASDVIDGTASGTNVYIIPSAEDAVLYGFNDDSKILLKDLALSELVFEVDVENSQQIIITNSVNSQTIHLRDVFNSRADITIVTKDGSTKLSDKIDLIYPSGDYFNGAGGTSGNDILIGSDNSSYSDVIKGEKGNDIIYGLSGKNTYVFDSGDGIDTIVAPTDNDIIRFTDVHAEDLNFDINAEDLVILYGVNDKVVLKDYIKNQVDINIEGAYQSYTTVKDGFESLNAQIVTDPIATGTNDNDYLVGTDVDNVLIGGKGNDTLSGGSGNNTYIFNKGDGNDTIKYSVGNDIIKFNDVKIEDISFSEYDLSTQKITLSYGESDTLTITGLQTDRNTVKIEDSDGIQYTVIVGDGDNYSSTVQKPFENENAIFISSTGKDKLEGNTGINVFTNCNALDSVSGSASGKNIFMITPEQNAKINIYRENDKIIFKDLELTDLVYDFDLASGNLFIKNSINNQ